MPLTLKDKDGKEATLSEVMDWAYWNIDNSMSKRELIDFYMNNISEHELIEWATDEQGRFPVEYNWGANEND